MTRVATARAYTPTALPSRAARALAFVAIVVGGLCGGLIGWSVTDLQCGDHSAADLPIERSATTTTVVAAPGDGDRCTTWSAGGALVGAVGGAGGVGVVSVLVLRAMGEWRRDLDVEQVPEPR